MAEENEFEQDIEEIEDQDQEHEDSAPEFDVPTNIWEELGREIHQLLENLLAVFHKTEHVEILLQEKPNDAEDKKSISKWLEKFVSVVKTDSEDEEIIVTNSRGLDQNDVVAKLERFKVKNLATGTGSVNADKK